MSTNIRDLTLVSVVSGADTIPLNDVTTNRTRAATVQQIADYVNANSSGIKTLNFVPQSGSSITLDTGIIYVFLDPSGTIASFTINLPPCTVDGQELLIMSSSTITALTVNPGAGNTLKVASTSTMPANNHDRYIFSLRNLAWYRA